MGLSPSKKTNVLFLAKIAPCARVIARTARGEIEFFFGQFKMASKFLRFDLAYLLNEYFTVIKPPAAKTKNLKDVQGKLQKKPTLCGPVSGHKRRKHVFLTSEGLQSAEINTKSSFSIQQTVVKPTTALTLFLLELQRKRRLSLWVQFPASGPSFRPRTK